MPKNSLVIAFDCIAFEHEPWELCLQGLTKDDESKYGDVQWNWELNYSSLMTNNNLKWESDADWNTGLEQIKRVLKEIIHVQTVQLNVFPENERAKKCYESVGFTERKTDLNAFAYKDESWGRCNMIITRS